MSKRTTTSLVSGIAALLGWGTVARSGEVFDPQIALEAEAMRPSSKVQ
jgi:hypothetical protein